VTGTNLNGIAATANGRELVAFHSTLGVLYRIAPRTGTATEIDLGADAVPAGDGIQLRGHTLYAVQNSLNQVTVVSLDPQLASGEVTDVIRSDLFRVPSTAHYSAAACTSSTPDSTWPSRRSLPASPWRSTTTSCGCGCHGRDGGIRRASACPRGADFIEGQLGARAESRRASMAMPSPETSACPGTGPSGGPSSGVLLHRP
jgi:hypothetical protein